MTESPTQSELQLSVLERQAKETLAAWMTMQRPMFSLMTEINGRLIEQTLRYNQAFLLMAGRQIDQEIQATRRLLGCRTMQDFCATCQDVMTGAQREIQIEMTTLQRLNQQIAGETAEAVRAGLHEAAQDMRH